MKKHLAKIILLIFYLSIMTGQLFASGRADTTNGNFSVSVAVLPVVDSLPLYAAVENGYFNDNNLDVTILPVANPVERDRLMQSGEIDGMLNELSTLALFNRENITIKAVITARRPMSGSPLFRILASPGSSVSTTADLKNIPIAVSRNTVIEYLTERILLSDGVDISSIVTKNVPVIPERYQLLMNGTILAAMLPDPLGAAALAAGAVPVIDDLSYSKYSVSVLSFRASLVDSEEELVSGFIDAWNSGAKAINGSPESYRQLLLEKIGLPEIIKDSFKIPLFPIMEVPDKEQWDDVVLWLHEKKLLDTYPDYEDSVSSQFIIKND
ncbi:MAG: ABC transporter substrate-binding protein [Spirochaetales bacterium]|nr:ABC transporter substrate-binding protein [Spirochaetales bacterium]